MTTRSICSKCVHSKKTESEYYLRCEAFDLDRCYRVRWECRDQFEAKQKGGAGNDKA